MLVSRGVELKGWIRNCICDSKVEVSMGKPACTGRWEQKACGAVQPLLPWSPKTHSFPLGSRLFSSGKGWSTWARLNKNLEQHLQLFLLLPFQRVPRSLYVVSSGCFVLDHQGVLYPRMQLGTLMISPPTNTCWKRVLCWAQLRALKKYKTPFLPSATLHSNCRIFGVINHQTFLENTR